MQWSLSSRLLSILMWHTDWIILTSVVGGFNPENYEFVNCDEYSQSIEETRNKCSKPPTNIIFITYNSPMNPSSCHSFHHYHHVPNHQPDIIPIIFTLKPLLNPMKNHHFPMFFYGSPVLPWQHVACLPWNRPPPARALQRHWNLAEVGDGHCDGEIQREKASESWGNHQLLGMTMVFGIVQDVSLREWEDIGNYGFWWSWHLARRPGVEA